VVGPWPEQHGLAPLELVQGLALAHLKLGLEHGPAPTEVGHGLVVEELEVVHGLVLEEVEAEVVWEHVVEEVE
jgi:hypothetical protein